MVNEIKTIYLGRLNKGFSSKVYVGSRVRHETPKEDLRAYRPKREYKLKTVVCIF